MHISILAIFLDELRFIITFFFHVFAQRFSIYWLQDVKGATESLVYIQNSCIVVKFSAIVGCREYSYKTSIGHEFVSINDHLMCPTNEIKLMFAIELLYDIVSKHITHASIVVSPSLDFIIRVRP